MAKANGHEEKYNVLIIGETGSGKSTLINYLTNFFHGGNLGQLKLAIPSKHYNATQGLRHSEANVADSSKSQTKDCIEYDFRKDDVLYGFIDTPGLSDTEGTQKDEEHIMQIMAAAEDRATLAAMMIVINGTQARATSSLRNTLQQMKSLVPDSFLDNIVVVLTNCNSASANFDLKQLEPWKVLDENLFHMNNSVLSKPKEDWQKNEAKRKHIENDWNESTQTIEQMMKRLKKIGYEATTVFKEMRLKRNIIKSELQKIFNELEKLQKLQCELDESKLAQQNISGDVEKYSNYKRSKNVEYTEYIASDFYSRICSSCSSVCYEDWAAVSSVTGFFIPTVAHNIANIVGNVVQCAIGAPECDKCKCSRFLHYDDTTKPVKRTKTVEEVLEDIKSAYDLSVKKDTDVKNKISGLNADIAALNEALEAKEAAIEKCCKDLKKVCSQFNLVKELGSIIDMMQKKADKLKSTAARRNADGRIRNIKQVVDKLSGGERASP